MGIPQLRHGLAGVPLCFSGSRAPSDAVYQCLPGPTGPVWVSLVPKYPATRREIVTRRDTPVNLPSRHPLKVSETRPRPCLNMEILPRHAGPRHAATTNHARAPVKTLRFPSYHDKFPPPNFCQVLPSPLSYLIGISLKLASLVKDGHATFSIHYRGPVPCYLLKPKGFFSMAYSHKAISFPDPHEQHRQPKLDSGCEARLLTG